MEQIETALIVIDMQADYIGEQSRNTYYPQTLIDKINKRITTAARYGNTVIYIKNAGRRNKKPYVSDFVEGLAVMSNYIIEKEKSSIFSNPALLEILKERGIRHIECIGLDGNCCVASSAIEASKLGYSVVFPLAYIGIKSMERFPKTKEKLMKANVQIIENEDIIEYSIRTILAGENSLLEDFLYEAIFVPEGMSAPPKSIINQPELQIYITDFGKKIDDIGLAAEVNKKAAGAVWVRIMNDYGHIDNNTPSFAISVHKAYRGMGIGTALMKEMLRILKDRGYKQASLAVQKANYAVKMYQKLGFEIVGENEEEFIMLCRL